MKDSYKILKSLLTTEKGTYLAEQNKYLFDVDKRANRLEIKRAVEEIYNVKVKKVNVVSMRGKVKRVRFKSGRTPDWKKAIVTLRPGYTIQVS